MVFKKKHCILFTFFSKENILLELINQFYLYLTDLIDFARAELSPDFYMSTLLS